MALNCPRCGGDQNRVEYQGKENGAVLWTVHYCTACCFTWRCASSQGIGSAD